MPRETTLFAYDKLKRCAFLRSTNVKESLDIGAIRGSIIEQVSQPRAWVARVLPPTHRRSRIGVTHVLESGLTNCKVKCYFEDTFESLKTVIES